MKKIPELIKQLYDDDAVYFDEEIKKIKSESASVKKKFIEANFQEITDDSEEDDINLFIIQFLKFLPDLLLVADDEVFEKLRRLHFKGITLRWFIELDDILKEIERLCEIEGLCFFKGHYLKAIISYITLEFTHYFLSDFTDSVVYNNKPTNIVFEELAERHRKMKYHDKKNQTPKMKGLEANYYKSLKNLNVLTNDYNLTNSLILAPLNGNSSAYIQMLNEFYVDGISFNKVYHELFPLLKMIMKSTTLLSIEEYFDSQNSIPESSSEYQKEYSLYKKNRVKKILLKK
jgi:hypothetical protein